MNVPHWLDMHNDSRCIMTWHHKDNALSLSKLPQVSPALEAVSGKLTLSLVRDPGLVRSWLTGKTTKTSGSPSTITAK